jgi:DNA-binding transcriptional regulator YbjK
MQPDKASVLKKARELVTTGGLINLSRRELCEAAGIPDGSFPHVMGCNFAEFVDQLRGEDIQENAHTVSKSRANPELRRAQILGIAVEQAKTVGYHKITRDSVAEGAGVSMGLVTRYFGTMQKLRRAVMRAAIARRIPEIVAQGLGTCDPLARKAPADLKARAAGLLANA